MVLIKNHYKILSMVIFIGKNNYYKNNNRIFISSCCYIIQYKFAFRSGPIGDLIKYILYFWQGVDSSKVS